MSKSVLYEDYKFVRVHEARDMLEELARRDPHLLHSIYCEFISPLSAGLLDEDLRDVLLRELGRDPPLGKGDAPPSFALFYVLREEYRRWVAPVQEPKKVEPDPVAEARAAPRGYVAIETVDSAGQAVSRVRCEVLLADGEVRIVSTDSHGCARLEPIPQGRCHISLLDLDGGAWQLDGGSTSQIAKGHAALHKVRAGECMSRICRAYGIRDWRKVWDDSANQRLREKRKNPSMLFPDDEIVLPARKIHQATVATDLTHRILVQFEQPLPRAHWSA